MTLSLMTLTYQNSTLRRIIPDTLDQLPWLRGHWEISCLLLLLHVLLLLPAFYMPERTTTFADTCLRLSRGMLTQRMNISSRRANDALWDLGSCIPCFLPPPPFPCLASTPRLRTICLLYTIHTRL
jgi:hypothetical protein